MRLEDECIMSDTSHGYTDMRLLLSSAADDTTGTAATEGSSFFQYSRFIIRVVQFVGNAKNARLR